MNNVAIITPFFNTENYIEKCIENILSQKDILLQYFLVDDGSTDKSSALARFYQKKDKRVTLIRTHNQGQGLARNIGIKLADAEYIYFMDSDDYLETEYTLSALYDFAEHNKLDICSPMVLMKYFDNPLECIPCLPCKSQFIKFPIIKKYGLLQPNISSGQDGVFSHLVLTRCTRIGMSNQARFFYTSKRDGSTFLKHLKMHDKAFSIIKSHYSFILEYYDKNNLWKDNALRLLKFMEKETFPNRLRPHFKYFTKEQKVFCIIYLKSIIDKAISFLDNDKKDFLMPNLLDISKLNNYNISNISDEYLNNIIYNDYIIKHISNDNIVNEFGVICKFSS